MSQVPTNSYLQLCVNDLLHPTEKSELLLEALTTTQLEEIEKTLNKIKEKKHVPSQQLAAAHIPQTANPSALHHDWTLVAAQLAKALSDSITTTTSAKYISSTKPVVNAAKPPTSAVAAGTTPEKSTKTNDTSNENTPSSPTITSKSNSTSSSMNVSDSTAATTNTTAAGSTVPNHEPRTEIREGVEWVSFVYSHHRVLRRYSIRTDIDQVDLNDLDDKFKSENCVYPRANLPRDEYKGNRWAYETECNALGWKLAYLNNSEIAGKRGLIQRAVDSHRNRYPSMRSRRVARQEKLMKGTLRKRKQRDSEEPAEEYDNPAIKVAKIKETTDVTAQDLKSTFATTHDLPKTVSIDDGNGGAKYRVRINVDSVSLDIIDAKFRLANCVYPRAMKINTFSPFASQRQLEEAKCNELGWKLAWLNPKQLANRKNLLQRVLDVYRTKFLPELNPRRNSIRVPATAPNHISIDTQMLDATKTPLTAAALAAQQQELTTINAKVIRRGSMTKMGHDDGSLYSGTTDSLDFHDCFSPPTEEVFTNSSNSSVFLSASGSPSTSDLLLASPTDMNGLMLSAPTSSNELLFGNNSHGQHPLFTSETPHESCHLSISSSSSEISSEMSPVNQGEEDESLFVKEDMYKLYTDHIQFPSASVDFDYIKSEDDSSSLMVDPLMSQLFHI